MGVGGIDIYVRQGFGHMEEIGAVTSYDHENRLWRVGIEWVGGMESGNIAQKHHDICENFVGLLTTSYIDFKKELGVLRRNGKECVTNGMGNDNVRTKKERNEVLGKKVDGCDDEND